jgi:hypothetical protein
LASGLLLARRGGERGPAQNLDYGRTNSQSALLM